MDMTPQEPTPLTDKELEHLSQGRMYAISTPIMPRFIATIKAERTKVAELKSKLLHQAMAWEASSIAAEARSAALVEALEELDRAMTEGWSGTGVAALQSIVRAALARYKEGT